MLRIVTESRADYTLYEEEGEQEAVGKDLAHWLPRRVAHEAVLGSRPYTVVY